jgi:hypothetical protein
VGRGNTTVLVIGMVLLVVGAQGAIRLLLDHEDAGLLGWLSSGFAARLSCYAAIAVAGLLLAGRGSRRKP